MINNVVLVGRLTKKPELRFTPSNIAVCQFTIAVNRNFNRANGEQEADFISCVAWRATAENMARFLDRGSLIGVEGRIQTRSYDQDGQRRYITEVVADSVRFLEPKNNNNTNDNYTSSMNQQSYRSNFDGYNSTTVKEQNYETDSFNPFAPKDPFNTSSYDTPIKESYQNPFKTSMEIDVDDNDLPF